MFMSSVTQMKVHMLIFNKIAYDLKQTNKKETPNFFYYLAAVLLKKLEFFFFVHFM